MLQTIFVQAVFVLRFLHSVTGQSTTPNKICSIAGTETLLLPDMILTSELPPLCEVVCYGFYYLDDDKDPKVAVTDIAAIEALVKDKKTVYQRVTYSGAPNWNGILKSMTDQGPGEDYKKCIPPMIAHLTKNSIAGVVLEKLGLFEACDVKQLNLFVKQLKTDLPKLKVCILVDGAKSDLFGKTDLTAVNPAVDLYVIDLAPMSHTCSQDTAKGNRLTPDCLKKVTDDVANSSMAKAPLMINFLDEVSMFDTSKNQTYGVTYSELCDGMKYNTKDHNSDLIWCWDTLTTFVGQAQHARDNKYGIMVSYLEYDDYLGHCDCERFLVASTYLSVLDGQSGPACKNIG